MSDLWGDHFYQLEQFTQGKNKLEDFNYSVHVSLKYKYIFVENPKVACSTIKKTLQGMELEVSNFERDETEDLHNREFSPLLTLQQIPDFKNFFLKDDFFIFCFVRNPYTRLLSCFLDKIKNPIGDSVYKRIVLKSMGRDENNTTYDISFEEFISVVEAQAPLDMDYHWRQQAYITCQESIEYDYIGHLESFTDDFFSIGGRLSSDFGQYYNLAIQHKSGANDLMAQYYTDELYERVYEIYEVDFVTFSYNQKFLHD